MEVKKVKFKVERRFRDRFSKEVYEVGSEYQTDDKDRAEFLQKEGYLGKEIKDKKQKKEDKK